MMAALQVLKFQYKQDRLDFTLHYMATEDEFRVDRITPEFAEQLLKEGKFDELFDLLATSNP